MRPSHGLDAEQATCPLSNGGDDRRRAIRTFTRDDGRVLGVVPGYRKRVLSQRLSYSPRPHWGDEQYAVAAKKKAKRTRALLDEFARWD